MVFVSDLIEAVMQSIHREERGKFDICSGRHLPISQLYDEVARALGNDEKAEKVAAGADDVKQMELNNWRACLKLGWDPIVTLPEGVAQAVAWYEANGVEQTYTHLTIPEKGRA